MKFQLALVAALLVLVSVPAQAGLTLPEVNITQEQIKQGVCVAESLIKKSDWDFSTMGKDMITVYQKTKEWKELKESCVAISSSFMNK